LRNDSRVPQGRASSDATPAGNDDVGSIVGEATLDGANTIDANAADDSNGDSDGAYDGNGDNESGVFTVQTVVARDCTECLSKEVLLCHLPALEPGVRYLVQVSLNNGLSYSKPNRACTYAAFSQSLISQYLVNEPIWTDDWEALGSKLAFRKYRVREKVFLGYRFRGLPRPTKYPLPFLPLFHRISCGR
jgi:hypothetical protein